QYLGGQALIDVERLPVERAVPLAAEIDVALHGGDSDRRFGPDGASQAAGAIAERQQDQRERRGERRQRRRRQAAVTARRQPRGGARGGDGGEGGTCAADTT